MTDLMANITWESPPLPGPVCPPGGDPANCTANLPCPPGGDPANCTADPAALTPHQWAERARSEEIVSRWTDGFALDYRTVLVLYVLFYVSLTTVNVLRGLTCSLISLS